MLRPPWVLRWHLVPLPPLRRLTLARNTRASGIRPKAANAARDPSTRTDGSGHCHRSSLDLDAFDGISTLEGLRDFMPELGARIKTFAASSSNRYHDPNSFRLARTHGRTPTNKHPPTCTHARIRTHARTRTHSLDRTSYCMHMCTCTGSSTIGLPSLHRALCLRHLRSTVQVNQRLHALKALHPPRETSCFLL
jgi:hypothetical protein